MLRRTLGTGDLIVLVVGGTMGVGPLVGPARALQYADGLMVWALLGYALVGLAALAGALTYAELAAMHPGRGGMYAHIRDGFGELPAFLFGWTLLFLLASGEAAAIARAAASHLGEVADLPMDSPTLIAAGMILFSALVSARGTRAAIAMARLLACVIGASILLIGVTLLLRAARGGGIDLTAPRTYGPQAGVSLMLGNMVWSYMGWHFASLMAGEARDPDRSFQRSFAAGVLAVIAAHLLMTLAYATLAVTDSAALGPEMGQAAFRVVLGPEGYRVATVMYVAALLLLVHVMLLTSARVTAAMAEDGLLFRSLGAIHPRAGTPSRAIAASAVLAVAGVFAGLPDELSSYTALLGWAFVALGALSIFVFRRRYPDAERPFRVPAYPWTPLVFVAAVSGMCYELASSNILMGAAVVLTSGFAMYGVWTIRQRALMGDFRVRSDHV